MNNIENPTKEQLKKMKLHELAYITSECESPECEGLTKTNWYEILKVQNGWVYYRLEDDHVVDSCYVPEKPDAR